LKSNTSPRSGEPRKIVVIGCKGTARNIIHQISDAIENHGLNWEIAGICIDEPAPGTFYLDIPILAGINDIEKLIRNESYSFIFALFKPEQMKGRYHLMQSLNIPANRYVNFIHPSSYVSSDTKLGRGNIILSNCSIQSGVNTGDNIIINSNVTIEHDSVIGDFNFFSAGSTIGSETNIGNYNFFGLNSSLKEKIRIGDNVFVGMGSVIIDNFSDSKIYGVPARKICDWN
jgi:sugar O-acyltransferase (sialic acid O-acetyltransferase NeuD family)